MLFSKLENGYLHWNKQKRKGDHLERDMESITYL